MGDMGEVFNAMKEHRKTTRRANTLEAESNFDKFLESAAAGGYVIDRKSEYHWNVHKDGRCVAQFWPSANKWQIVKTGKIQHGDHDSFRLRLSSGRL